MEKTYLTILFIFILKFVAQSGEIVLFNQVGLRLSYESDYYNTIKIKDDLYDQYKITAYVEYNGNKPIFVPENLSISYNNQMQNIIGKYYKSTMSGNEENYIPYYNLMKKMPNSRENIDFLFIRYGQQTHDFWVPGTLSRSTQLDTSSVPRSINHILLNGYKSKCYIYILVDKEKSVPTPVWSVGKIFYVEPYLKKNNWAGGPSTFEDCLEAIPIGKKGDMPEIDKEKKVDNNNSNTSENDLKIREREACQKLYKNNKPAYYQLCNKTCSTLEQLKEHIDELENAIVNGFTPPTPPPKKKAGSSCTISN